MATYVVIGASRGIGLELARLAKQRGHHVIAVCRTATPNLNALGVQVEAGVDVTSDEAVAGLASRLGDTPIDVLVNNAGIASREGLDNLDFDAIRKQFEVNSLGPLRVIKALRHALGAGAKIAVITSQMGSIADNTSGGVYGYRMSKAALNIAAMSLSHDLAPHGIAVGILHPGFVRTDMTKGLGNVDPAESANGLLDRIDELTVGTSGRFCNQRGEPLPW